MVGTVLGLAASPAAAQDISINLGQGGGAGGLTERVIQLIAFVTVLSLGRFGTIIPRYVSESGYREWQPSLPAGFLLPSAGDPQRQEREMGKSWLDDLFADPIEDIRKVVRRACPAGWKEVDEGSDHSGT